ncbi:MAG: hypothetical protein L6R41_002458 [Letrouitia leprolyta]|nr:MAG: hypothetical protein L6R41_002458 [Letrouitia leprolyta]
MSSPRKLLRTKEKKEKDTLGAPKPDAVGPQSTPATPKTGKGKRSKLPLRTTLSPDEKIFEDDDQLDEPTPKASLTNLALHNAPGLEPSLSQENSDEETRSRESKSISTTTSTSTNRKRT